MRHQFLSPQGVEQEILIREGELRCAIDGEWADEDLLEGCAAEILLLAEENKRLRTGMAEAGRDLRTYVARHMSIRELVRRMNNLLAIADRLHDLSSPSEAGAPAGTSAPSPQG